MKPPVRPALKGSTEARDPHTSTAAGSERPHRAGRTYTRGGTPVRTREHSEQRTGSRRPRGQQSGPGDDGGSGGGPAAREAAAPGEAGRQPPSSAMLRSRPRGRRGLPQPQTADESRAVLTRGEIRRHSRRLPARAPPQSAEAGPRPSFYGERPPLAARSRALARATPPRAARHHRPAPRPANVRCRGAAPPRRLPSA